MRKRSLDGSMDDKVPAARPVQSLYREATAETRAWAVAYIARNREMLALMARL
jgi:hypothetical protein